MYFSFPISMYQGTKIAFQNALFLRFFFKVQNLAIFGRLHFCVVNVIPNLHVKDHFN